MDKAEILDAVAREGMVEQIVRNSKRGMQQADREDLSQMVYQIMCEYPEDKVRDMWEGGWVRFFIARVVFQLTARDRSTFNATFRRDQRRQLSIDEYEMIANQCTEDENTLSRRSTGAYGPNTYQVKPTR